MTTNDLLAAAIDLVKLHLEHTKVEPGKVPGLVQEVYGQLLALSGGATAQAAPAEQAEPEPKQEPAVPIEQSVSPDGQWVICLEDGRAMKMMKRHLRQVYGMSPSEYRAKWGLPPDHPVVAPAYRAQKAAYAKQVGLGTEKLGRGKRGAAKRAAMVAMTGAREDNVDAAARPGAAREKVAIA